MIIGDRLKSVREQKNLSQGDVEKRTGLLRCYISRVENGHTVPALETIEKFARAQRSPCTNSFMTGKSLPKSQMFSREGQGTILLGAIQGKMPVF